jgi:hypothetical protein
MISSLTRKIPFIFCRLSIWWHIWFSFGPSFPGGTEGCHGFWMHTSPDGRSGYLVPGWLATYYDTMLMCSHSMSCFFRRLISVSIIGDAWIVTILNLNPFNKWSCASPWCRSRVHPHFEKMNTSYRRNWNTHEQREYNHPPSHILSTQTSHSLLGAHKQNPKTEKS